MRFILQDVNETHYGHVGVNVGTNCFIKRSTTCAREMMWANRRLYRYKRRRGL